ncbi:conserved hypothetical protein [Paraburkholderia tropica]
MERLVKTLTFPYKQYFGYIDLAERFIYYEGV